MMITFRYIEIFDKVASCGKMSVAAKELFISQSAVSQAIAEIERQYNIQLFNRFKKRLVLTPAGQEFWKYAHQVLLSVKSMEHWLEEANSTCIRVGATGTVGSSVLSPILLSLQRAHPEFHAEITIADTHRLERMLLDGTLDVALVGGKISSLELYATPAIRDRMVIFCGRGHKLFGQKSIRSADLNHQQLVLREIGSVSRDFLMGVLNEANAVCTVAWTSHDNDAIKDAVIHGFGISILSHRLIRRECEAGLLWGCEVEGHPMERDFSVVYHKDRVQSEAVDLFVEACLKYGEQESAAEEDCG